MSRIFDDVKKKTMPHGNLLNMDESCDWMETLEHWNGRKLKMGETFIGVGNCLKTLHNSWS
jgi:hypothetical protein